MTQFIPDHTSRRNVQGILGRVLGKRRVCALLGLNAALETGAPSPAPHVRLFIRGLDGDRV